jgi:integrase-like protein
MPFCLTRHDFYLIQPKCGCKLGVDKCLRRDSVGAIQMSFCIARRPPHDLATNVQFSEPPMTPASPKQKFLDQCRDVARYRQLSRRTEDCYVGWIRQFILHHGKRHPSEMGPDEIREFLIALAVHRHVAASTQNQALSALLFLYRDVLRRGRHGEHRYGICRALIVRPPPAELATNMDIPQMERVRRIRLTGPDTAATITLLVGAWRLILRFACFVGGAARPAQPFSRSIDYLPAGVILRAFRKLIVISPTRLAKILCSVVWTKAVLASA